MMMPGRKYSAQGSYRYGFNGKENDNEVKGEGSQQDYGMRIYDPRLSKFLSVDPLTEDYPELTPYQFASNTPVWAIDLDGAEGMISMPTESQGRRDVDMARSIQRWWNSPTSPSNTKALVEQYNAYYGTHLSTSDFNGQTNGQ